MREDDYRRWGDDPADHRALDAWLTRDPWADLDPVSVYTREEAIADDVLADATDAARALGIALPAALTSRAWGELGCGDAEQLTRALRAVARGKAVHGVAGEVMKSEARRRPTEGPVHVRACFGR
jgi:hypothetical protein